MKTHPELISSLAELAPAVVAERRSEVINAAREAGLTWRVIAETLGMTQVGVQRAPGVDSPWNQRHHAGTDKVRQ